MKFNRNAYWTDSGLVEGGAGAHEYDVLDCLNEVVEGSGLSSIEIRLENMEKCVAFLLEQTAQPFAVLELLNQFTGYEEKFISAGSKP